MCELNDFLLGASAHVACGLHPVLPFLFACSFLFTSLLYPCYHSLLTVSLPQKDLSLL
jgi:hypothetical protein